MPSSKPTSLASLSRGIVDWAERRGVDRRALLDASDLSLDDEDLARLDDHARLPHDSHVRLWRETERLLADPDFGLTAVSAIVSPASLGVVGLLAMTSRDVEESVARAVAYGRLLKEDLFTSYHLTPTELVIELRPPAVQPRALVDASLAAYRHFMTQWTAEEVTVREVLVQHQRPADVSSYEATFGAPVRFGQPTNALILDRQVARIPLVTAQPAVAGFLERVARAELGQLEPARDTASRAIPSSVRAAVREAIETGDASIAVVARRLGTSARTLQRSLGALGVTYREVTDAERWAIAGPLVASTDLSIDEIALRLGYAESKAFRRAFRRWSGVTPGEVRRAGTRRER